MEDTGCLGFYKEVNMKKKKTKPGAVDDNVAKRIKKRREALRKAGGKKKGK